jgi:hypothetical protein
MPRQCVGALAARIAACRAGQQHATWRPSVLNHRDTVIVAGDMDADAASDSMRVWTGRHVIEDTCACCRSA